MRFMTLIKSAENSTIGPPPAKLLQAIGRLGGDAAQAGVLVDTAGLMPTAAGARVRLEASGHEVVGAYAIFNVQSVDRVAGGAREPRRLTLTSSFLAALRSVRGRAVSPGPSVWARRDESERSPSPRFRSLVAPSPTPASSPC